jgi:hypothetical protein
MDADLAGKLVSAQKRRVGCTSDGHKAEVGDKKISHWTFCTVEYKPSRGIPCPLFSNFESRRSAVGFVMLHVRQSCKVARRNYIPAVSYPTDLFADCLLITRLLAQHLSSDSWPAFFHYLRWSKMVSTKALR